MISCWIPPDTQRRSPTCTNLSISIIQIITDSSVLFVFTVNNNGPLVVNNAVFTITFSGSPPIIVPPGVIIPGNVATLNIGTIEVGQSFDTAFGFDTLTPTTIVATVSTETPLCDPNNSTATSIFTPMA